MGAREPRRGPEGRDLALRFASVVLLDPPFVHGDRRFTYSVPDDLPCAVGTLARVPIRGRNHTGLVIDLLDRPDVERPVPIRALLGPGLPAEIVDLAGWVADRYLSTLGEALAAAVPERVAAEEKVERAAPARSDLIPTGFATEVGRIVDAAEGRAPSGAFVWRPSADEPRARTIVALATAALRGDGGVLVLVPEVRVGGVVAEALGDAFGDALARLGSDRSARQRYRDWLALRSGTKRIALGGRGAVFAPVPSVGLVVVDDESHASYKEGRAPRFHARAVAAERARRAGATLVLVGVPPSIEARAAAGRRPYVLVAPPRTAERARRPPVTIVDRRKQDGRHTPAGRTLVLGRRALTEGGRVLLLCHRGGEAVRAIARRARGALGSRSDVVLEATKGETPLAGAVDADLVVATSFVAKDLMLEGFGLLAILDADAALAQPEFRAAEDAFGTWWRAGRWLADGHIVIETADPSAPAVRALARWDPDVLFRAESARRKELGYPPFAAVARIDAPAERADEVAATISRDAPSLDVLGPAERAGRHVVVVRARLREVLERDLRPIVERWRAAGEPMRVDIDPREVWVPKWRSSRS